MMDDIIERLQWAAVHGTQEDGIAAMTAAVAVIKRQREELWAVLKHVEDLRAERVSK